MKRLTFVLVVFVLTSGSDPALSDGKFYRHMSLPPPKIPYQRALLLFDGSRETLILQSRYHVQDHTSGAFVGWVVPVPAVPELASMDPHDADEVFWELGLISRPNVTSISSFVVPGFIFLIFCAYLLSFIEATRLKRYRAKLLGTGIVCLLFFPVFCYRFLSYTPGVDVLKEERVGIYDVKVIESQRPEPLIQWLNNNEFQFDDSDTDVFGDYLARGWCFVVAKIDSTRERKEHEIAWGGLVAPLILRFTTEHPIYPLALTSTVGREVQVLLYVLAKKKTDGKGPLKLQYADRVDPRILELLEDGVAPQNVFSKREWQSFFLSKLEGRLTPEELREDLKITFDDDDSPYRREIVEW